MTPIGLSIPLPDDLVRVEQQPDQTDIVMADGIFAKQMRMRGVGLYVPQHSHTWDHITFVSLGSIRVWKDGVLLGDFHAPAGLAIPAGTKHTFLTLTPDTIISCVHRIDRTGAVEIESEHSIVEPG